MRSSNSCNHMVTAVNAAAITMMRSPVGGSCSHRCQHPARESRATTPIVPKDAMEKAATCNACKRIFESSEDSGFVSPTRVNIRRPRSTIAIIATQEFATANRPNRSAPQADNIKGVAIAKKRIFAPLCCRITETVLASRRRFMVFSTAPGSGTAKCISKCSEMDMTWLDRYPESRYDGSARHLMPWKLKTWPS